MTSGDGTRTAETDFVENLRSLGALYRDLLNRQPSTRALARAAGVSPTTIGKWLEGEQVPQKPDCLMVAVHVLRTEAERRGLLNTESIRLLDSAFWAKDHKAVLLERAAFTGRRVERTRATTELARQGRQDRMADLVDLPRPVTDWTPGQLGVHPAIAGLRSPASDFVLPKYIMRSHDERLRAQLQSVKNSGSVELIILRGESCTGKTRSAYEAVNACLPDWQLLFPKDTESLISALSIGAIEPNTVLWLNEAQNFLYGDKRESCAAFLRRRLEGVGPVVIILTLWPEYHRVLLSGSHSSPEGSAQVKALLAQGSLHIVPNRLSSDEMRILEHDAKREPSLIAARQAVGETGRLTQVLAAGPDLVDHYEHTSGPYGCYGQALISAAIDARRLGLREPLPLDFLFAAAPGYLTDAQRAEAPDDWEEGAIEYAHLRVKNVTSAFSLIPKSKGIGHIPDVVEIADYLHYYGRRVRALLCPPESFWEAATSQIPDAQEVERLATEALSRLRIDHGTALVNRAADLGSTGGLWDLAFHNSDIGNHQETERIFRQLGTSGEPEAWLSLAAMKEDDGQVESSREFYAKAADMGHLDGLREWADNESINDREDTAIWIYRLLISRGDTKSFFGLASLLAQRGKLDKAEELYRRAAGEGDVRSAYALVQLLEESGRRKEIQDVTLPGSMPEDSSVLLDLMLAHEQNGKMKEAEEIFWKLIELGEEKSAAFLPWSRASSGMSEAKRLAIEAASQGFLRSLEHVTVECMRNHRDAEAEWLINQLTELGGSPASLSIDYALYLERNGKSDQAELVAEDDEKLGSYTLLQLAKYRAKCGHVASARKLALRLLQEGEKLALTFLVELEEMQGNLAEAERLARIAVDAGEFKPLKDLVDKYPRNEALQSLLRCGM